MNAAEKNRLSREAELQIKALKTISRWKTIAIAISTIGVALAYAGFAGESRSLFFGISGIVLILLGAGSASVIGLGLKNGRRNVDKMLKILNEDKCCEV